MRIIVNHTPLPWTYISEYDEAYIDGPTPESKGMINFYLCDTAVGHANAAFIVRAANAHKELLERAKQLDRILHEDEEWDGKNCDVCKLIAKAEGRV
jgi:hypothetical protein